MLSFVNKCKGVICYTVLLHITVLAFGAAAAADKTTIYFYNPEASINNFASLKKELDAYLSGYGSLQFQPVSSPEVFEAKVRQGLNAAGSDIFIMSGWHLAALRKKIAIEPLMTAIVKGRATYKKVIVAGRSVSDPAQLKGATVASAGTEAYTKYLLRKLLGKDEDLVNSIKILIVPKDIDALMAIGFGMAKAALASELTVEKLQAVNPAQYRLLNQMSKTEDMPLPVVVIPAGKNRKADKGLKALSEMDNSAEGRNGLKMLGFDSWSSINKE